MKFCKFCGAQLKDEARFCPKCGKAQGTASVNPGQPVQPQAPRPQPAPQPVQTPTYQQSPAAASAPAKSNTLYLIIGVLAALVIAGGAYFALGSGGKSNTATAPAAKTEATAKPAAQAPAAKAKVDAKASVATLQNFEDRLATFAGRINGGQEDKAALVAVGNVLKDDITLEKNKLHTLENDATVQRIDQLLGIQWKRADCMVRGLKGYSGAYAEGGGYYDEFQAKFAKFKQDIGA